MSDAPIPRDELAVGDCLEIMARWPEHSIDLAFADPPYNIGYEYDQYHDRRADDEYIQWTCDWIDACTRLLKPTGSIYILIGDEYAAETRLHLKKLEREGKLLFRNWIIWHYTFGQRCKAKFNRSHAHLFYAVGSAALRSVRRRAKIGDAGGNAPEQSIAYQPLTDLTKSPPFTFNYDAVALPSARMTTYNDRRQNPRGKLPDDTWYLRQFPDAATWHMRPQEAQEADGMFGEGDDTWCPSRLCGTFSERTGHPCQLPEALLERIVKVSSNRGDLVFDPFAGSGTTLAVAKRLGRGYLGCEMSEQYAEQVRERLERVTVQGGDMPSDADTTVSANGEQDAVSSLFGKPA